MVLVLLGCNNTDNNESSSSALHGKGPFCNEYVMSVNSSLLQLFYKTFFFMFFFLSIFHCVVLVSKYFWCLLLWWLFKVDVF